MQPSETELATLRDRLAEAKEVMRPFARAREHVEDVLAPDDYLLASEAASEIEVRDLDAARAFLAQGEGKGEPDFRAPVGSDQRVVHASNSPTRGCTLEVDNPRKEVMPDVATAETTSPHATSPQAMFRNGSKPPKPDCRECGGRGIVSSLCEIDWRNYDKACPCTFPDPPPDYRAIAARLMDALNLYEEKHIPGQYQFCGHWPGYAELHPSCDCTGSTGCKRIPSALAAARAAGIGGE